MRKRPGRFLYQKGKVLQSHSSTTARGLATSQGKIRGRCNYGQIRIQTGPQEQNFGFVDEAAAANSAVALP